MSVSLVIINTKDLNLGFEQLTNRLFLPHALLTFGHFRPNGEILCCSKNHFEVFFIGLNKRTYGPSFRSIGHSWSVHFEVILKNGYGLRIFGNKLCLKIFIAFCGYYKNQITYFEISGSSSVSLWLTRESSFLVLGILE